MKQILYLFSTIVLLSCSSVSKDESKKISTLDKRDTGTGKKLLSSSEIKKIITEHSWGNGLSQWSKTLDISKCTQDTCDVELIFSSPQVCPIGSADDEWCDEVQLKGKINFVSGGFLYIDNSNPTTAFCELKKSEVSSWMLAGETCPSDLIDLFGTVSK